MNNHVKDLVSLDFFVVPTVTYRVLFVLVILVHEQRRVVHFNVTERPFGSASITTMNDWQREKEGDIWHLQHHNSNNAWPPWKRK